MTSDEVMVYAAMALVPAVASTVAFLALVAVHRRSISMLVSCVAFLAGVVVGMFLSHRLVHAFAYLLHGDGALAIVAAPVTGAILTVPVASYSPSLSSPSRDVQHASGLLNDRGLQSR